MAVNSEGTTPSFVELNEVASEKNGGEILFATDDWFAVAENLLKEEEPIRKENVFTDCGAWMDGWETRRKRVAGHDWTIIALGKASVVKGFCVDTCFFTGNYAPRFSIQAAHLTEEDASMYTKRTCRIGTAADMESQRKISFLKSENWETIVPMSDLRPGYPETRKNYFEANSAKVWTHLRFNIYPDGGVARLRVYGWSVLDNSRLNDDECIDLIGKDNGGVCVGFSNAHYGHPKNLIRAGRGVNMADGWETARRLDRPPIIQLDSNGILKVPGNEWAIFKLGHPGTVNYIVIDTKHFKGNYPDNIKVEGTLIKLNEDLKSSQWKIILGTMKLSADKEFLFTDLLWNGPVSHVKITIAPDGGVSRVRIWGRLVKL